MGTKLKKSIKQSQDNLWKLEFLGLTCSQLMDKTVVPKRLKTTSVKLHGAEIMDAYCDNCKHKKRYTTYLGYKHWLIDFDKCLILKDKSLEIK